MAATPYTFDLSIGFLKDKVALPKEYTGGIDDEPEVPSSINEEKHVKNAFGVTNLSELKANIPILDVEKEYVIELIEAIKKNDIDAFWSLINRHKVNINGYPNEDLVPIVETIRYKRWPMLEALIDKKANLNVEYEEGKTVRNFLSEKNMDAIINKMSKLKISSTDIPVTPKISRSTTV